MSLPQQIAEILGEGLGELIDGAKLDQEILADIAKDATRIAILSTSDPGKAASVRGHLEAQVSLLLATATLRENNRAAAVVRRVVDLVIDVLKASISSGVF